MSLPPPRSTLFPYTTLFRSAVSRQGARGLMQLMPETAAMLGVRDAFNPRENIDAGVRDRKSTRLNSSHLGISYAVFCLTKKKMARRPASAIPREYGCRRREP